MQSSDNSRRMNKRPVTPDGGNYKQKYKTKSKFNITLKKGEDSVVFAMSPGLDWL